MNNKKPRMITGNVLALTNLQINKAEGKVRKGWMRNEPCVCGSGKKFKKCCWDDYSKKALTR